MSRNVKKKDEFATVEQALGTSEAFIEKNQRQILIAVGVVVALVLLVLAVRNFYIQPRELAAENEMSRAQMYFANGNFERALNGDDFTTIGFRAIATDFRMTRSGNLAAAYAGISYFRLGDFHNAIKFLSRFNGKDSYLTASVIGLIGDSYVELGEVTKAIGYFERAANMKNDVMSPIFLKKAGLAHESLGNLTRAAASFQKVKDLYPNSQEAADIDKYIARVTQ